MATPCSKGSRGPRKLSPCSPTAGGGPEAATRAPPGWPAATPATTSRRGAQGGFRGNPIGRDEDPPPPATDTVPFCSCRPSWPRSARSCRRGCPKRFAGACWAICPKGWGTGWLVPATVTRPGASDTCQAPTQRARRRTQSSEPPAKRRWLRVGYGGYSGVLMLRH